jgi:hypothetical protein
LDLSSIQQGWCQLSEVNSKMEMFAALMDAKQHQRLTRPPQRSTPMAMSWRIKHLVNQIDTTAGWGIYHVQQ